MKRTITIAIIVVLAVGLGYYLSTLSGGTGGPSTQVSAEYNKFDTKTPSKKNEPGAISDSDHVKGPKDAKNTLIVYEDFQCPACRYSFTSVVPQFLSEFPDTKFVFRHYPLVTLHKNAGIASYAAEAAAAQNKFWELYDILYTKQNEWASEKDPMAKLEQYATEAGITNLEQFKSDITSKKYKERIERDINEGNDLGIQGTPSYYVNGHKLELENGSYEEVKSKAQQFLAK